MGKIIKLNKKKNHEDVRKVAINFTKVLYIEEISEKRCKIYFEGGPPLTMAKSARAMNEKMDRRLKEIYNKK